MNKKSHSLTFYFDILKTKDFKMPDTIEKRKRRHKNKEKKNKRRRQRSRSRSKSSSRSRSSSRESSSLTDSDKETNIPKLTVETFSGWRKKAIENANEKFYIAAEECLLGESQEPERPLDPRLEINPATGQVWGDDVAPARLAGYRSDLIVYKRALADWKRSRTGYHRFLRGYLPAEIRNRRDSHHEEEYEKTIPKHDCIALLDIIQACCEELQSNSKERLRKELLGMRFRDSAHASESWSSFRVRYHKQNVKCAAARVEFTEIEKAVNLRDAAYAHCEAHYPDVCNLKQTDPAFPSYDMIFERLTTHEQNSQNARAIAPESGKSKPAKDGGQTATAKVAALTTQMKNFKDDRDRNWVRKGANEKSGGEKKKRAKIHESSGDNVFCGLCYNCGKPGHTTFKCTSDKANCPKCGRGHLEKFHKIVTDAYEAKKARQAEKGGGNKKIAILTVKNAEATEVPRARRLCYNCAGPGHAVPATVDDDLPQQPVAKIFTLSGKDSSDSENSSNENSSNEGSGSASDSGSESDGSGDEEESEQSSVTSEAVEVPPMDVAQPNQNAADTTDAVQKHVDLPDTVRSTSAGMDAVQQDTVRSDSGQQERSKAKPSLMLAPSQTQRGTIARITRMQKANAEEEEAGHMHLSDVEGDTGEPSEFARVLPLDDRHSLALVMETKLMLAQQDLADVYLKMLTQAQQKTPAELIVWATSQKDNIIRRRGNKEEKNMWKRVRDLCVKTRLELESTLQEVHQLAAVMLPDRQIRAKVLAAMTDTSTHLPIDLRFYDLEREDRDDIHPLKKTPAKRKREEAPAAPAEVDDDDQSVSSRRSTRSVVSRSKQSAAAKPIAVPVTAAKIKDIRPFSSLQAVARAQKEEDERKFAAKQALGSSGSKTLSTAKVIAKKDTWVQELYDSEDSTPEKKKPVAKEQKKPVAKQKPVKKDKKKTANFTAKEIIKSLTPAVKEPDADHDNSPDEEQANIVFPNCGLHVDPIDPLPQPPLLTCVTCDNPEAKDHPADAVQADAVLADAVQADAVPPDNVRKDDVQMDVVPQAPDSQEEMDEEMAELLAAKQAAEDAEKAAEAAKQAAAERLKQWELMAKEKLAARAAAKAAAEAAEAKAAEEAAADAALQKELADIPSWNQKTISVNATTINRHLETHPEMVVMQMMIDGTAHYVLKLDEEGLTKSTVDDVYKALYDDESPPPEGKTSYPLAKLSKEQYRKYNMTKVYVGFAVRAAEDRAPRNAKRVLVFDTGAGTTVLRAGINQLEGFEPNTGRHRPLEMEGIGGTTMRATASGSVPSIGEVHEQSRIGVDILGVMKFLDANTDMVVTLTHKGGVAEDPCLGDNPIKLSRNQDAQLTIEVDELTRLQLSKGKYLTYPVTVVPAPAAQPLVAPVQELSNSNVEDAAQDSAEAQEEEAGTRVEKSKLTLSPKQVRRAYQCRQLHCQLSHPSDKTLINSLNNGVIVGSHLTAQDVRNADLVLGQCLACMVGKTQKPSYKESLSSPPSRIGEKIYCDIIPLPGCGDINSAIGGYDEILLAVDGFSNMLHMIPLKSKSTADIMKAFDILIAQYVLYGHKSDTETMEICADSEATFRACRTPLAERKVKLTHSPPSQHNQKLERQVHTIKQRVICVKATAPIELEAKLEGEVWDSVINDLNDLSNSLRPTCRLDRCLKERKLISSTA